MNVFSPAKLNLFLHITGKRTDGYHNLQTVFCRLDFGDTLSFTRDDRGQTTNNPLIRLTCDTLTDDINENLIVKSANALTDFIQKRFTQKHFAKKHSTSKLSPIHISVNKKIPTGAGLGGGSSNAGMTLLALNELWQLNLHQSELIDIAKTLGADVPFFVLNQPYAIGEGIGEILTPINLPKLCFLLLFPNTHNSTQGFFNHPKLNKNSPTLSHKFIVDNQMSYLSQLNTPFYNAFESIALENPAILTAFDYLADLPTHATPRLTGTGSTVFLPIDGIDDNTVQTWQNHAPCPAMIATTL